MIFISKSITNSKKTKITNIMYNIQQLYKLNIVIFMHNFFNKQLPTAFNNVFRTKTSNVITIGATLNLYPYHVKIRFPNNLLDTLDLKFGTNCLPA